jgi:hypothetical protein
MNSGVADAAGLAWALAAMLEGWGGPKLADAYEAERRPTAHWHRAAAARHVDVRIGIATAYAEAGELEAEDTALAADRRAQVAEAIKNLGMAEYSSMGVQLGYRYDESPIVFHEPNPPEIDPLIYTPSTRPGARLPHVFLADGESVHDKLGTWFTLLVFNETDSAGFEMAAKAQGVPLTVLRIFADERLRKIYERNLILVRPDQHVAWRGDTLPDDIAAILKTATGN